MDKFIFSCAVSMLTMFFVGCDSVQPSKPLVIGGEEPLRIDPDSTQSEDINALEIVLRDFAAGYPDFDNFQSEAYESQTVSNNFDTWTFPGYADNEDWLSRREIPSGYATYGCGNATTWLMCRIGSIHDYARPCLRPLYRCD